MDTASERMERLEAILECAIGILGDRDVRVFGSYIRWDCLLPGDVDIVIDDRASERMFMEDPERHRMFSSILSLGRGRNYGFLDPFIETRLGLYVRNPACTSWTPALNVRALRRGMKGGISISDAIALRRRMVGRGMTVSSEAEFTSPRP